MAKKYEVCFADEIAAGDRRIVTVAGRSIGIFNLDNTYYAVRNSCPHKGAPLCKGVVTGKVSGDRPGEFNINRDGEILRCPWHGWEFDLRTGESVFNPHAVWVRQYPVDLTDVTPPCEETDAGIETYPVTLENSSLGEKRKMLVVEL